MNELQKHNYEQYLKWIKHMLPAEVYNGEVKAFNTLLNNLKNKNMLKEKNRRVGNTTRAIDYYIQRIFNNPGETIEVKDPYDHPASHKELLRKILNRLKAEHRHRVFQVNEFDCTIMLFEGAKGWDTYKNE